MKIVFFLITLICIFAIPSKTYAIETVVKGKLLGYDGKPIKLAHVITYLKGEEISHKVGENGNFNFTLEHSGRAFFQFTGVNHEKYDFELLKLDSAPLELEIRMAPNTFDEIDTNLTVIGNFNEYDFESGAKMTLKDGKYFAEVENNEDTLFYQILGFAKITSSQREMDRSVNGTMQDGFVYDGGGDYRSYIVSSDNKVRIEFNPSKLPSMKTKPDIKFKDDATLSYINFRKELDFITGSFQSDYFGAIQKREYEKMDSIKLYYMKKVEDLFESSENETSKLAAAIEYIQIASYGQTAKLKDRSNKDICEFILGKIPADSPFWENFKYDMFWFIAFSGDPDKSEYFHEAVSGNPDNETRQTLVFNAMQYYFRDDDSVRGRKYYNLLMEIDPESRLTRNAKREYAEDKNIEPGKIIPDFTLLNIDDQKDSISTRMLRGKYVLVDVWGTWCGPCRMEMKYLHSAYEKFKDKNFTILSIALEGSPEQVLKYREGKWNMPWNHAFGGSSFDAEIFDTLEVTGVPKVFLINPGGEIIALENRLRGNDLEKTLAELVK